MKYINESSSTCLSCRTDFFVPFTWASLDGNFMLWSSVLILVLIFNNFITLNGGSKISTTLNVGVSISKFSIVVEVEIQHTSGRNCIEVSTVHERRL